MRSFAHRFSLRPLGAALALALATHAHALTLGQAVVQSQPGEPLRVEIPLQRVTAAEANGLQARQADAQAYKAARMEADASLEGLTLEVQERAGQRVLVLTGQSPAKAGFVDVLLELRWASGRMVRDVGLLLGQASADRKPRSDLPTQLRVQPGDTAGQLAQYHKDDSISLEQMLLALLRSNPDAFIDNNVNRLKAGAVLNLPESAAAQQVDRSEARQALQLQAEEFATYRQALAERLPTTALPDSAQAASGKLQASAAPKAAAVQDKLTLSKPGGEGEERIALQREAQETAQRAQEMARNINELSKIVEASGQAASSDAPAGPATSVSENPPATAVQQLAAHPLTPVAAGSLLGLLTLLALWRVRRPRPTPQALKVDFDLELPPLGPLPEEPATAPAVHAPVAAPPVQARAAGFKLEDISLDLPSEDEAPLRIRFELAEELWRLGQENTSRALVQEVAEQASGALQVRAQQWLAERA